MKYKCWVLGRRGCFPGGPDKCEDRQSRPETASFRSPEERCIASQAKEFKGDKEEEEEMLKKQYSYIKLLMTLMRYHQQKKSLWKTKADEPVRAPGGSELWEDAKDNKALKACSEPKSPRWSRLTARGALGRQLPHLWFPCGLAPLRQGEHSSDWEPKPCREIAAAHRTQLEPGLRGGAWPLPSVCL